MENKKKASDIFYMICLIVIAISFFGCTLSALNEDYTVTIVFGVLFVLGIITLIVAAKIINKKLQKTGENKTSYESSSKKEENYVSEEDLKTQKLIWKFDAFVRDNYPNLPLNEFKPTNEEFSIISNALLNVKITENDLRPIVNRMIKHLGQTFNYASIRTNRVAPGQDERAGYVNPNNHEITVNYHIALNANNIFATLAHEISHCYQFYEFSKYPGDEKETELFTDFLAVYLGFGQLMLKGKNYRCTINETIHSGTIGYLNEAGLKFAQTTANARKEMKDIYRSEAETVNIFKNKVNQIKQIYPIYLNSINNNVNELNNTKNINPTIFEFISQAFQLKTDVDSSKIETLIQEIENEINPQKAEKTFEKLNIELKHLYECYSKFAEIIDNLHSKI